MWGPPLLLPVVNLDERIDANQMGSRMETPQQQTVCRTSGPIVPNRQFGRVDFGNRSCFHRSIRLIWLDFCEFGLDKCAIWSIGTSQSVGDPIL